MLLPDLYHSNLRACVPSIPSAVHVISVATLLDIVDADPLAPATAITLTARPPLTPVLLPSMPPKHPQGLVEALPMPAARAALSNANLETV